MEGYEKHSFRIKKDSEYQMCLKDELDDYIKWVAVNHNEYADEGLCSIGRTKTKSGRAETDKPN